MGNINNNINSHFNQQEMTHAELVRNTAEKMARMFFEKSADLKDAPINEATIGAFLPLAELAVEMKAEGFDEGVVAGYIFSDERGVWDNAIEKEKQQLGLTKPTDND